MTGESKSGAGSKSIGIAAKTLHIVNRMISPLDRLAFLQAPNPPAALFVVGLPRSGTTLLYELIVQAFHVGFFTAIHNYTFGLPNLTTRITSASSRLPRARYESKYGRIPGIRAPAENSNFWIRWFPESPVLGHYVAADTPDRTTIVEANEAVGSLAQIAGAPMVFKNVYLSLSIGALLKTFADARILVMERELESVTASVYQRRSQLKQPQWWSIRPPLIEDVAGNGLPEQVAFQCVRSRQIIHHEISAAGNDRCMVVSYDEACESPGDLIKRIGDWLPPAFRARVDPSIPASFERRPSRSIPPNMQRRIAERSAVFDADRDSYLLRVAEAAKHQTDTSG